MTIFIAERHRRACYPPPVRAGRTYVSQHGDLWVLADYEAGWLYVSAAEH